MWLFSDNHCTEKVPILPSLAAATLYCQLCTTITLLPVLTALLHFTFYTVKVLPPSSFLTVPITHLKWCEILKPLHCFPMSTERWLKPGFTRPSFISKVQPLSYAGSLGSLYEYWWETVFSGLFWWFPHHIDQSCSLYPLTLKGEKTTSSKLSYPVLISKNTIQYNPWAAYTSALKF